MSYTAKHKAAGRYGLVDQDGNWLDFLGTKDEAEAKAHELNQGDAKDDSMVISEETKADSQTNSSDSSCAPAPFVPEDQNSDSVTTAKSTQPQTAQANNGKASPKHFVLTDKGWLLRG